jgi:uncharacterized protein
VATRLAGGLAAAAAGLAAWGLFESQWLSARVVDVPVQRLPRSLDGLAVLHLSDFHAGTPSFNDRTMRKAIDFGVRVRPDLVAITGDLIAHHRAVPTVIRQLARLDPPLGVYAITGNHEVGDTNDPFSRGVVVEDWRPSRLRLLRDERWTVTRDGVTIEVAGVDADPRRSGDRPEELFADPAAFRILLAHYPDVAEGLPPGTCSLVLAGHLHGGQICLPGPRGKVRLSHAQWRFDEGVFQHGETTVVVSRGTGTTLVPFRLLARPEACLLRLRPA